MDLQKGKILLDKINALYTGMNSDVDNIASIEKDLMRSYVRQFYEVFLETGKTATAPEPVAAKQTIAKSPVRKPAPTPRPVVKVKPPAPKPVYEQPRVIELSEDVQEFVTENIPPPPVPASPKPSPRPAPVVLKKTPPPAPTPAPLEVDEDVLQLFEQKQATDLSERLSSLPVKDLMKAMGLNERILTVNELFGGDANAFKSAMTDLNKLSSFEDAKKYLAKNVINQYGWIEGGKKKKAKVLIKTIRRRYT